MASTMMDSKTEGSVINWDNFPAGLRVMVVDDDELCLKLVETMLQKCSYEVTTFNNATEALEVLRRRTQEFDLVLSDVYMPDIDGFKLLETIGLELDLPVIMMSSNGETTTVLRGVTHGAVDFLIKPVRIEELRNLWQHVVRRRRDIASSEAKDVDSDEQSQDKEDQAESSKKRKDLSKEGRDLMRDDDGGAAKKPRVVWSVEMHQQFVNAVNQLGIDKAVPKKILELMNVEGLTRENVASHLQKYRLYLKRVAGVSGSTGRVKPIGPSLVGPLSSSSAPPSLPSIQPPLPIPGGPHPQGALSLTPAPSMNPEALANPFAGPGGLLGGPPGGGLGGFQHPGLGGMSPQAQAAVAAQAANMMGAINAMNLNVAGAMNLSRLNSLQGGNAAGAASMAMQLGMGGMSPQQLSVMGMGLNPGLAGLSLPNMPGMGPMTMAQMGQLQLGMMGGMGAGMLGSNPMGPPSRIPSSMCPRPSSPPTPPPPHPTPGPPNPQLHGPPDQPHPLLNAAHLFASSNPPPQLPPPPSSATLAQELAMMESGAFPDFATSTPMPGPATADRPQPPPGLDGHEYNVFRGDPFGAGPPLQGVQMQGLQMQGLQMHGMQLPGGGMPGGGQMQGGEMQGSAGKEQMDDFLNFLLKDSNMQHDS